MKHDPAEPIGNVFTTVDRLATIAARARADYSHTRKNNISYVIPGKTDLYQRGLCDWLQSPVHT